MNEERIFIFEYVQMDAKWYAYLYTDEFCENRITGKELSKYINENYEGNSWYEKYNNYKSEESEEFEKYAHENNILLIKDVLTHMGIDCSKYFALELQNKRFEDLVSLKLI